jgi:hypothetical protein
MLRAVLIPGIPVVLTIAAFVIIMEAGTDSDPLYAATQRQTTLYLGAASAVIAGWAAWAVVLAVSLVKRKLARAWGLILIVGLAWGGLLCVALYRNAAEFIDQTTRFGGENWPILKYVFRQ